MREDNISFFFYLIECYIREREKIHRATRVVGKNVCKVLYRNLRWTPVEKFSKIVQFLAL